MKFRKDRGWSREDAATYGLKAAIRWSADDDDVELLMMVKETLMSVQLQLLETDLNI